MDDNIDMNAEPQRPVNLIVVQLFIFTRTIDCTSLISSCPFVIWRSEWRKNKKKRKKICNEGKEESCDICGVCSRGHQLEGGLVVGLAIPTPIKQLLLQNPQQHHYHNLKSSAKATQSNKLCLKNLCTKIFFQTQSHKKTCVQIDVEITILNFFLYFSFLLPSPTPHTT